MMVSEGKLGFILGSGGNEGKQAIVNWLEVNCKAVTGLPGLNSVGSTGPNQQDRGILYDCGG